MLSLAVFFFSSRRRHTRSDRDWSSDVCSSDLARLTILAILVETGDSKPGSISRSLSRLRVEAGGKRKIGRAACRGRGEISVGGGSFKKKKHTLQQRMWLSASI